MKSKICVTLLLSLYMVSCKTGNSSSQISGFGAADIEYPNVDFEARPSYIPNDVVVLTFDDGPDEINTAKVLDVLKSKNVKASFFINTNNGSAVAGNAKLMSIVKRIASEGHELANHTFEHQHLGELSAAAIESQLAMVDKQIKDYAGVTSTLVRAPFGEPFQDAQSGGAKDVYNKVAPVVARHGVHIGWNIDSFDYLCVGDANCVFNNTMGHLPAQKNGDHGVILMHSIHEQTASALPRVIDEIRARGYRFWSVEDVLKSRYGKSSAELMNRSSMPSIPSVPVTSCGASNWVQGQLYHVGDKVVYDNQIFTALNENPGYDPKISTWFWLAGSSCTEGSAPAAKPPVVKNPKAEGCSSPAWTEGKNYPVGTSVVFEAQVFTVQNEASQGTDPKISTWFWKAGASCK